MLRKGLPNLSKQALSLDEVMTNDITSTFTITQSVSDDDQDLNDNASTVSEQVEQVGNIVEMLLSEKCTMLDEQVKFRESVNTARQLENEKSQELLSADSVAPEHDSLSDDHDDAERISKGENRRASEVSIPGAFHMSGSTLEIDNASNAGSDDQSSVIVVPRASLVEENQKDLESGLAGTESKVPVAYAEKGVLVRRKHVIIVVLVICILVIGLAIALSLVLVNRSDSTVSTTDNPSLNQNPQPQNGNSNFFNEISYNMSQKSYNASDTSGNSSGRTSGNQSGNTGPPGDSHARQGNGGGNGGGNGYQGGNNGEYFPSQHD